MLSVSDTGTGIQPATSSADCSSRSSRPNQRQRVLVLVCDGWGAIKQSGGHVEVESELGKGRRSACISRVGRSETTHRFPAS